MTPATRTATPEDEPALYALWSTCFGPSAAHLPALYALDPDRHRRTFIAAGAGRGAGTGREAGVDAAIVVVPRLVRGADGTPELIGGIGNVATHPSARGQGLVRSLLAEAVSAMESEGFAWSLLFTGMPGVYEGSGWRTFARRHAEGQLAPPDHPAAPTPTPAPRVRAAGDGDDLPALHQAAHATRPLTAVRTEADWRVRVPAWYGPHARWLVVDDPATGAAAGYAVAEHVTPTRTLELREYGTVPGADVRCLAALFAAHAALARTAGLTHARVPLTPEAELALPYLVPRPAHQTDRSGMAHPLRSPAPPTSLTPSAGATHWYGDSF